jgi:hypothetical protein
MLYQEQIVLDHVVLEVLNGKCPVCHFLYKVVFSVLFPRLLDVLTVKNV